MKIKTLPDVLTAVTAMSKKFMAYTPESAPAGDARPEHYGYLFFRPLVPGIFQFAVRANKARIINVTLCDDLGQDMIKLWRDMQAVKPCNAFVINELPDDMRIYSPESLCQYVDTRPDNGAIAANLWHGIDNLLTVSHTARDDMDIDLMQLNECVKAVKYFVAPTPSVQFTKGARQGVYGNISITDSYVKVMGGCQSVYAEAIVAPLR